MGLEQVLQEIHRNRAKIEGSNWKPSLDTITEIPEVPQMMDT
ncbi:uncharacterized protein G2W53_033077 [Senna tora]|uniref:Uncharacterized protein n=1 Tax=Senna tora TaxID=362788 RepID=A0A834T0E3_9FABA|nr:uncharacterized protein G2W53_041195 [Senna tora]KAF7807380.1 uncharacterized protein G2W53_039541 [Senna tora]KAF7812101.1 uncharacterized protein G2W53_033077 [Senna tora]